MIDGMPRPRPPFIRREVTRHGRTVWYFRRGKRRIRLPDPFGSPEFWRVYNAALAGETVVKRTASAETGTLAWLIARYKESGHFATMKKSTQKLRDGIMLNAVKTSGDVPARRVSRKQIEKAMDRRAATPHAANNFLSAMSVLFAWALKNGHVDVNPCIGVDRRKAKIDGFHTWTVEEVDAYRARHATGTTARLALDLMLFTGLRRSDAFRAGRQHVRDGVLSIRMQKTGKTVHIPVFAELRASIDATRTGDLTFLLNERGRQFGSAASFGSWFRDRCNEAGLPHCTAHGLRKAGATIAAEGGATAHQLLAMYGWSRLAEAEVYTRDADRKRLAKVAAERIADAMTPHLENRCGGEAKLANENK